jgi:Tol biopolymer transport system component
MKKTMLLLLILAFALASCGTLEISIDKTPSPEPPGGPIPPTHIPPLSMSSTSEEIQKAMLTSATKWRTIFMDGVVTWYDQTGTGQPSQAFHQQVWIDQMNFRFRYLSGPVDGEAELYRSSDGTTILDMDLKSGQSQTSPMPSFARLEPQFVPTLSPDTAYPQPLWGQMGAPLGEMAYPSDFAQTAGVFVPVAIEKINDRPAIAVQWTYKDNQLPSFKAWLDLETSVILKMQNFGKGGGEEVTGLLELKQVVFDSALADSLFGIPASTPQFSDIGGAPLGIAEPGPPQPAGQDPLGDLYFFTLPHQAGQSARLVRLPGSCVARIAACPSLELLSLPFPLSFNLTSISWSPDGKWGAFAYPDNPSGSPYKLFVFDPHAGSWTSVAQFPYIDPPFWSPDGNWLAFRQQDGQGGEDVYVVHRDGTGLKALTASGKLPPEGRPYVMDGWLTENIVVRSAMPGDLSSIYLIRASDGAVRPMFDTLLTKGAFFPSHDGSFLVFDNYNYDSQKHVLQMTEPDGAHPVDLATFSGGSLYPIVWSPDNSRVAFVYYSAFAGGASTADVYIVGPDGRNLTQVYKGGTIGRILFSPDGRHLLVEETSSPTGGHLFIVDLSTLESHMLQAPGLTLDADWYAPSWRP